MCVACAAHEKRGSAGPRVTTGSHRQPVAASQVSHSTMVKQIWLLIITVKKAKRSVARSNVCTTVQGTDLETHLGIPVVEPCQAATAMAIGRVALQTAR